MNVLQIIADELRELGERYYNRYHLGQHEAVQNGELGIQLVEVANALQKRAKELADHEAAAPTMRGRTVREDLIHGIDANTPTWFGRAWIKPETPEVVRDAIKREMLLLNASARGVADMVAERYKQWINAVEIHRDGETSLTYNDWP